MKFRSAMWTAIFRLIRLILPLRSFFAEFKWLEHWIYKQPYLCNWDPPWFDIVYDFSNPEPRRRDKNTEQVGENHIPSQIMRFFCHMHVFQRLLWNFGLWLVIRTAHLVRMENSFKVNKYFIYEHILIN